MDTMDRMDTKAPKETKPEEGVRMSSPDHPIWGSRGPSLAPSSTIPDNKYSVLSDTEKLIIAECQDEAFYYRSLPLAISFGWGTHTLHGLGWCRVQGLPPGVA